MLWAVLVGYVLPLLAIAPWFILGSIVFFVVLYLLRVVPAFGRTVRRQLREPARKPTHWWRWALAGYAGWCFALATVVSQLYLADALWDSGPGEAVWRVFLHTASATVVAVLYAPVYHNYAEWTGDWASPGWRELPVWGFFQRYHQYRPQYLKRLPGDLAALDRERIALASAGATATAIERSAFVLEEHAFLHAACVPEEIFTPAREAYLKTLPGVVLEGPTIYAAHPHGVSAVSAVWGVAMYGRRPLLPRPRETRCAVADLLFYLPIMREIVLLCGCISVSEAALYFNLARGRDLFLMPGGMREQALARRSVRETVYQRLGFCRLANIFGIPIVPIYAVGEEQVYAVWNVLPRLRAYCYDRWGYAFPWVAFGPLPGILTPLVGRPIPAMTNSRNTREDAWLLSSRRRRKQRLLLPLDPRDDELSQGDTPLTEVSREHVTRRLHRLHRLAASLNKHRDVEATRARLERTRSLWLDRSVSEAGDSASVSVSASVDVDELDEIYDREQEDDIEGMQLARDQTLHRRVYAHLVDLLDAGRAALGDELHLHGREGATVGALRKAVHRERSFAQLFGVVGQ